MIVFREHNRVVLFYILCNDIAYFLLCHCKAKFHLSLVLCLMFLYGCLPTLSHSISWGNCKGIWIHKSHAELRVAKRLQL